MCVYVYIYVYAYVIYMMLLFSHQCMSNSSATLWIIVCQAPQSVRFPSQQYWNGLPFPSPGDIPNPGIEPGPPALQADYC